VGSRGYRPGAPATNVDPTEPTATYPGHGFAEDLSLATGSSSNMTIQIQKLALFSSFTCMTATVRKCCITGALSRSGNALSLANRTLPACRIQKQLVIINSSSSPVPSIGPSDTYRVLGVDLNTSLTFTKHLQELERTITSLINAISTSLLTKSRRIRVIRGLLIVGKHFTLQLGLFSDSQLDNLDGQICRALRSAVSSVGILPRTALQRPTTELGYGLSSLKAHAAQLTVCHQHKLMNTPGYRGNMARSHIHTISTTYTQWPTKSIMSRNTSPHTLKYLVRAQRDASTMFHHISPLSLTANPIASTLRAHFTHQDNTLLVSPRDNATHLTDPYS
jgi:hypothetical protein